MLVLLLELAFQSASLTSLLRVVFICMQLLERGILQYAPLNLFLKKFVCQLTQMDYVPEIVAKVSRIMLNDILGNERSVVF